MALTKIVASRSGHRTTLIPFPGTIDDGSTLSLDFTTGVLDPRLTFTRGTNATFINSSGLVEWAAANMFRNTVWGSTSLPTGWLANASNTGTVTYNGNGTITCAATSQIAWIYPDFPYIVTQTGLSYICSFRVVSISGPTLITDILSTGNFTAADYFINGVSVGASPSAPSGNVTGPCVVSVRVNATSTSWFPRLGVGVQGLNRTATITMSEPHSHPGTVPVPYLANTSTSASNHNTPRFDHDPTTLAPRGLSIEGSAINLLKYSAYADTNWLVFGGYSKSYTTNITSPANDTTAALVTFSAVGHGLYTNNTQMGYTNTVGATYTMSAWIRATSNTTNLNIRFGDSAVASSPNIPITTTWTRYSYSYVAVSASGPLIQSASGTPTGEFEMWGFQLEAGSGYSSYIPTGASQGSRAADNCVATIANVSGFNANEGTAFIAWRDNTASDTTVVQEWAFAFGLTLASGYGVFMPNQTTAFPIQGGVSNAGDVSSANLVIGGLNKAAIGTIVTVAPNTGTCRLSANGASVTTGTNISGYNAAQTLSFGQRNNNLRYLNGWIQQFKYWPSVLPDTQLQALTT